MAGDLPLLFAVRSLGFLWNGLPAYLQPPGSRVWSVSLLLPNRHFSHGQKIVIVVLSKVRALRSDTT